MVKLNKIYTRTGDKGDTGLVNGPRRSKADLRVEAYGTIDEVNADIGVATLFARDDDVLFQALIRIQNDLFDLGADLSTPEEPKDYEALRIVPSQVEWLENMIDHFNAPLKPLTSFILPGGSELAAFLHLARTTARRAERHIVALKEREHVSDAALSYINRLSDFLFVAARHANHGNDPLWTPGKNRQQKGGKNDT